MSVYFKEYEFLCHTNRYKYMCVCLTIKIFKRRGHQQECYLCIRFIFKVTGSKKKKCSKLGEYWKFSYVRFVILPLLFILQFLQIRPPVML